MTGRSCSQHRVNSLKKKKMKRFYKLMKRPVIQKKNGQSVNRRVQRKGNTEDS